ncbi:hypothetical protein [Streptomyces sp. DH7]|uniref:hypothetical protein n=1 Tax=Streptomyces sp. DH7 TaxID=2857006 RepID=UPI001E534DB7|nr:hypothetical protein [Streptomyces sp. DH7]
MPLFTRTHSVPASVPVSDPEKKRSLIKTVGQIQRVGRGRYVTTGWEIDAPDGSGRGRVAESEVTHTGTLGGFTVAELCRMAHGPRCRRC